MRLVLTLEETFQAVRRTACESRVRTGFDRDGRILFQDIEADYLIGAYTDIADRVVGKGSYPAAGPYTVPAVRIVARSILSHTVPSTAFRGFGNPQINWAVESTLDEGAKALGIDRLEIRLRNLARKGDRFIPFDTPCDGDWEQTVRLAAERIGWGTPLPEGRGRGIALGIKSGPTTGLSLLHRPAPGATAPWSSIAGTSDMGQGARTVFAQIAAQELGAPLDWVTVVMGDTAVVPYDQQTSASRSTVLMGNSVLAACRDIQGKLRTMAARRPRGGRGRRSWWTGAWCACPTAASSRRSRCSSPASAGWAASSRVSARSARTRSPGTRWAGHPRSSSSTARPSRPRWTARPAT